MIKLTRLNGEVIYLNYFQIQYYLVKDTVEHILQKVTEFLHSAVAFETKIM